jgi:hypothetical protein
MKDPRTIEEQAAQLARWLDEHPGSAPPEGVDPDVLESIYALRPDLAPAPSFSVDDILADITTGPFADILAVTDSTEPPGGELVELPVSEPAPTPEPEPQPAPEPAVVDLSTERRRRSPWLWSGLGAVAAAAMALIVAIPMLDGGITDEALYAPVLQQPATIAEAEPTEAPEPDAVEEALARHADAPAQPARDAAGPVTSTTTPALGGVVDGLMDSSSGSGTEAGPERSQASKKERASGERQLDDSLDNNTQQPPGRWYSPSSSPAGSAPAPEPAVAAAPSGQAVPTAPAPPPAEPAYDPAPTSLAGGSSAGFATSDAPADLDLDADMGGAAVADAWEGAAGEDDEFSIIGLADEEERSYERAKRSEADASQPLAEAEEAEDYDAFGDATRTSDRRTSEAVELESAAGSRVVSRSRGHGGGRSSRAGKVRADQGVAAAEVTSDEPAASVPAATPASMGLDELRAQANPLDYRSDWYLSDPSLDPATKTQLATAYGQAQAAVVAGDASAARAALEPMLSSSQPQVAQDVAFRVATLQLQQGQRSTALATVDRGLAASASPTVHRSRLLAMRGSILEEQGDTQGAMDAYRQAISANASRR